MKIKEKLYRVGHFNRSIQIFPKVSAIQKNCSNKSCWGQWGPPFCIISFDLEINFQGYLKVEVIF